MSRWGKGSVQLCLGYLMNRPAFAETEMWQQLYDRLTGIVGPLTTKTLNGFPSFAASKLNGPAIRADVALLLTDIVEAAREWARSADARG